MTIETNATSRNTKWTKYRFQLSAECHWICAARCTCYTELCAINQDDGYEFLLLLEVPLTNDISTNLTLKIARHRRQCRDFKYVENMLTPSDEDCRNPRHTSRSIFISRVNDKRNERL